MSNKVMLRLLALMLLFLATVANRGSNLNQKPAVVPKEKPFRRQGWGLHPKEKPVKEVKNVKDKKQANASTKETATNKAGTKAFNDIDELMDGFE